MEGKTQIYTGNGKGKTTAALGLALRAIGHNLKVGIIFFDKGGDYYGERRILDFFQDKGLSYKVFGKPRILNNNGFRFTNTTEDIQEAQLALDQATMWLNKNFDILILDEINTTIKAGLLKSTDVVKLIKDKPTSLELILTGRNCPDEIMVLADLITEMKDIKHYIKTGQSARKGIEY